MPGASECQFMEHDPIFVDYELPVPEKCPMGEHFCCDSIFGIIEDPQCKDCGCQPFQNSHENSRGRQSLDSSTHLLNASSVLFPLSVSKNMSKWQIVFFNNKIPSMTPSRRVEALILVATSGKLGEAVIRVKIGDRYVIDKTKVIESCCMR